MRAACLVLAAALLLPPAATRAQQAPPNRNDIAPALLAPRFLDDRQEMAQYLSALPKGVYKIYEVGRRRYYLDDIDDIIKNLLRQGLPWEQNIGPLLRKHARPGSTALDVGAHIGTHAITLSLMVGPQGRVYAFEPQRKIYRELVWNLRLNGIANVVPLKYAVGDQPGIVNMGITVAGNEGHTAVGEKGDRAELRALDEFPFQDVSFIKIDVEGYEDHVLDGARKTIARHRPVLLVEIQGGYDYDKADEKIRARVDATKKKLAAMGYPKLERVGEADYLGLP